jgi:uncharacterized membrane protein
MEKDRKTMMGLGLIISLLLIGVIVYALGCQLQGNQPSSRPAEQTPLEILKARFARGKISQAEYEEIRRNLES